MFSLPKQLVAESLGTGLLVATVVGSGIMAETLTEDTAVALLGNTLPTGAILVVLIMTLGPISGAHLNPAVTLAFLLKRSITSAPAAAFICAQILGGIAGSLLAHAMFDQPIFQSSITIRTGQGQWIAEIVATFGLVTTILAAFKFRAEAIPMLVGLYITAAYWFTASTSFANPAVTIARGFSDTFAGIRPLDVGPFILAQIIGSVCAVALCAWLLRSEPPEATRA